MRRAKKFFIILAIVIILLLVCNDFLLPWYVNQGGNISVPSVNGKTLDEATRILDSLGFAPRKGDVRTDKDHPPGTVFIQNPIAGTKVKKGRRVYMTVSGGEPHVQVPNIIGRTLRDARFALDREGLKLGVVEYQPSQNFPPNTVIEQKVKSGSRVRMGVYVSIVLSEGKTAEKIIVPDLSGKTLIEAGKILSKIGLRVGNITYLPSLNLLPNTIVDQFPRVGELSAFSQAVDLFVVKGGEKKKTILEN